MKVFLIDHTGAGHHDPLYAARLLVYTKNTRLKQGGDLRNEIFNLWPVEKIMEELDYISKTLRSSWEFVDFTFQVEGVTRAFTHQMVRTRTASYAQQAQRVVDMSDFEALMPETTRQTFYRETIWRATIESIQKGYQALVGSGVPAQDARGLLPTNVLTNIVIKMNLRTFADLVGKRDNPRAQGEYTDVIRAMKDEALKTMGWIQPFLYPERTQTPALDAILRRLMGSGSPVDQPELNAAMKELDGLKGTWG